MKAFVTALLLALAWLPGAALAQSTPQAGRDYVEIPGGQAWAARPGRIEVAELFGYTCPHCATIWTDDDRIAKELGRNTVSEAVPNLVEEALREAGSSSDNVTVVAMEWETPDQFASTIGISTDSISDGVFASTIQAGMPSDSELDDLDEDAIERSIAEINEAIRRSAARKA